MEISLTGGYFVFIFIVVFVSEEGRGRRDEVGWAIDDVEIGGKRSAVGGDKREE